MGHVTGFPAGTSDAARQAQRAFPRRLAGLAGLFAVMLVAACGSPAPQDQKKAPPPPSVVVEAARMKDLSEERSFTGRIEAIDKVQLRARVQGFLKARDFAEGTEVKKGQLLFEIEPDIVPDRGGAGRGEPGKRPGRPYPGAADL